MPDATLFLVANDHWHLQHVAEHHGPGALEQAWRATQQEERCIREGQQRLLVWLTTRTGEDAYV
jgi:hypothetical protein